MTPELPPIRTFTARELCDIALLADALTPADPTGAASDRERAELKGRLGHALQQTGLELHAHNPSPTRGEAATAARLRALALAAYAGLARIEYDALAAGMKDIHAIAVDGKATLARLAEALAKGMRVIARGRLRQRSWQAQDGTSRTMTEMTVDEIGPSLRYANAQVRRTTSGAGHGTGATYGDPNRPAYTGAAPGAGQAAAATDPWAGDGYGQDGTEPEF